MYSPELTVGYTAACCSDHQVHIPWRTGAGMVADHSASSLSTNRDMLLRRSLNVLDRVSRLGRVTRRTNIEGAVFSSSRRSHVSQ